MSTNRSVFLRLALAGVLAALIAGASLLGPSFVFARDDEEGTGGDRDRDLEVLPRPELITERAERGIERGVEWLARNQQRDGSWGSGGGYGAYPAAMTGLAGTAIAMHGDTTSRGRYSRNLRTAVDYLLRLQQRNGLIAGAAGRSMYGHGFSMLFLSQVYGTEEDPARERKIHDALAKGAKLTARSQSRLGGWLYTPDSGGDEGSVTVTQVQALRGARDAGVHVPGETIKKAVKYIEMSVCPDGGIAYRAGSGGGMGGSRPPITAAAVAVLYNAGQYDSPMVEKAIEYCKRRLIRGQDAQAVWGHWFYTHLYLAQAMYQRGGKDWEEYFPTIRDRLLKMQARDGSWQGDGVGTVYGTALALTILQLPYEALPIYQR